MPGGAQWYTMSKQSDPTMIMRRTVRMRAPLPKNICSVRTSLTPKTYTRPHLSSA